MSDETRKRISESQRARYARAREAASVPSIVEEVTRVIAAGLVAWADEKDDASRYPIPPWSVSAGIAGRVVDAVAVDIADALVADDEDEA